MWLQGPVKTAPSTYSQARDKGSSPAGPPSGSHRPADPVLKAIKEGDDEALKAMIKAGRNLAEPNSEGWLPLHEAAYYGQLACLRALQQGNGGEGTPDCREGRERRDRGP